jgi:predicted Zn-dependent protease
VNAAQVFDRAHRAFQSGDLPTAHKDLLGLLRVAPNNVAVLHLLGLTEKGLGKYDPAKKRFELAIQLAPGDAELLANAANLFAASGDAKAALSAFERAIALAPTRMDFRLNRAITLLDLDGADRAVSDIEYLLAQTKIDARTFTVAGQVYRAVQNYEAAIASFRRALEIEPFRPAALAGLGELLLEQGDVDAVAVLKNARQVLPNEPGLTLSFAQALESVGRFEEAIALLDNSTAETPDWITGHLTLARMRGEAGDLQNVCIGFERALISQQANVNLWSSYAAFLRSNDTPGSALLVLERAKMVFEFNPLLAMIEAGIADDIGDTDRSASLLHRIPKDYVGGESVRVRHLIHCGQPEEASRIAEAALSENPDDIALWSLTSLCWRMIGDPREAWLNPAPELFMAIDIGLPEDAHELAETLRRLHVARHHPAGQSLRHGTQTRGSLFRRSDIIITALREHIRSAVLAFVAQLPPADPRHPLLRHRDQMLDFAGSWSVRLTRGGFHVSHIHPAGILSSAFYVSLPDMLGGKKKAGWLAIGDAPPELNTGLAPYAMIEPRVGRLALFPSYLFHGTRPFDAGERLSVAFDIAPA